MGIAFYDPQTGTARLDLVNLLVYTDPVTGNETSVEYEEKHVSRRILHLIKEYHPVFKLCRLIGIEKQMRGKGFAQTKIRMCLYEQCLRTGLELRYGSPYVRIVTVNAKTHRKYWGIGTGEHGKNKDVSYEFASNFFDKEDLNEMRHLFDKKDGKKHVDALEAYTIALLLYRVEDHIINIQDKDDKVAHTGTAINDRKRDQVKRIRSYTCVGQNPLDIGGHITRIQPKSLLRKIKDAEDQWRRNGSIQSKSDPDLQEIMKLKEKYIARQEREAIPIHLRKQMRASAKNNRDQRRETSKKRKRTIPKTKRVIPKHTKAIPKRIKTSTPRDVYNPIKKQTKAVRTLKKAQDKHKFWMKHMPVAQRKAIQAASKKRKKKTERHSSD
ncbi:MAG: hypothetical protein ACTSUE_09085 [Promethearchaeota archaeon]